MTMSSEQQQQLTFELGELFSDGPGDELVDGYDTEYGFTWGPMEVVRAATVYGKGGNIVHFVLSVFGDRGEQINVIVTPGGRSVKVTNKYGEEMKTLSDTLVEFGVRE